MKFTEKLLRYPLPDQLKAVLEKFDGDFDASHLNKLDALSESRGFTWYERRMLKRAYHKAKRNMALNTAMEVVLNLKKEDPHEKWYSNPAQNPVGVTTPDLYQRQVDRKAHELKQKTERRMMGMPF